MFYLFLGSERCNQQGKSFVNFCSNSKVNNDWDEFNTVIWDDLLAEANADDLNNDDVNSNGAELPATAGSDYDYEYDYNYEYDFNYKDLLNDIGLENWGMDLFAYIFLHILNRIRYLKNCNIFMAKKLLF